MKFYVNFKAYCSTLLCTYRYQLLTTMLCGGDCFMRHAHLSEQMYFHWQNYYFHFLHQTEKWKVFSQLKIIKSDKQTSLTNDTLNDLLTVSMID